MSKNEPKTEIVKVESIFTPVMDIQQAVDGFKKFEELKSKLLDKSDYAMLKVSKKLPDGTYKSELAPFVKKSGWNKLACFFGASTRTVSSKKTHNPDGSYEWEVTVEAYKRTRDGCELYNVQRSAIVSSLEKEKTDGQKNSPRKSHDVFASAETRAEGRALSAYFGTGEVSAEEMGADTHEEPEYCPCAMKDTKPTSKTIDDTGLHGCTNCGLVIAKVRYEGVMKFLENQK